jgi:hypothetical protein
MQTPERREHIRTRCQSLRVVLDTIRRVTGVEPNPQKVLQILAEELDHRATSRGRCVVTIRTQDVLALLASYQHQALINRVAAWELRMNGTESSYAKCYPQYVAEAKSLGFEPYAYKTFQNRALKDPLLVKEESVRSSARRRLRLGRVKEEDLPHAA